MANENYPGAMALAMRFVALEAEIKELPLSVLEDGPRVTSSEPWTRSLPLIAEILQRPSRLFPKEQQ